MEDRYRNILARIFAPKKPDCVKKTKKNRQTGTAISVWRPGTVTKDGWAVVCEDHDGCLALQTRELAVELSSKPLEWCCYCVEAKK